MTPTPPEPRLGTLLGVWAHPDDEAYLSAGLMARNRQAGHRVVVATATRGELGTADPGRWPPERLGPLREVELRDSLAAVGVHEHRWLGHRDGELPRVPTDRAVAQVEALLDEVRPDVVVTFGPDGMTGHDDHRTVSGWVTRAWQRTGRRSELWYATLTPEFHATWGALNQRIGVWFDGAVPPETPRDRLAAELVCAGELLDRKHDALRAHASQTRPLEDLLGTETFRSWFAVETFVAAPSTDEAPGRSG
jgi:LmbE family N-acetylglucosaminyl deacetylase